MIQTYKDLKGRKWEGQGIPKWLYRSGPFNLPELPEVMKLVYEVELLEKNPGYELFYFSNADCEQFIKEEWGDEYLDIYNILIPTAYRADFLRYLLLYTYGGIWGDFSQIPLVTFDELIKGMDRVFCLDRPARDKPLDLELYNAIMMVKPNDEVVKNAITISKANIISRKYCDNALDITGPITLGEAFRASKYHNRPFDKKIPVGITDKTKILLNPDMGIMIVDQNNQKVFFKKLGNHREFLYPSTNKHYYEAWLDRTVFNM